MYGVYAERAAIRAIALAAAARFDIVQPTLVDPAKTGRSVPRADLCDAPPVLRGDEKVAIMRARARIQVQFERSPEFSIGGRPIPVVVADIAERRASARDSSV